jgi:hypothetical protein
MPDSTEETGRPDNADRPWVMDENKFQSPDAATLNRIPNNVLYNLDDNRRLIFWKDGVWHPAGECFNCDALGPAGYHCKRCEPTGYLYVGIGMTLDNIVFEPQKLGMMALLTHATIQEWPDPIAAHSHLMMLLKSYHEDAHPEMDR